MPDRRSAYPMASRRQKQEVLAALRDGGIVPVIRADSADTALRIVDALVAGGIRTLEITMTVPDAIGAIKAVSDRFGSSVLLGAGTVTSRALAEGSIDAGAEFLVTPCVVPEVIAVARERGVAVLPGASYLKALKGPFPQIKLCPTGGVNLQTIGDFVKAGASAVGVGGELVSKAAIDRGDFDEITRLAAEYVKAFAAAKSNA